MSQKPDLRIAATSRARVQIAAQIVAALYRTAGPAFRLTLVTDTSDSEIGGNNSPIVIGRKRYHFAFANPAGLARMALLGQGCFTDKIPLRAVGVFPSWDRLVFAIHRDTGIHSLEEIKEKKFPLRVSTRVGGRSHTTLYVVDEILKEYGFSLGDIERWGGKILRASNPSGEERAEHIKSGKANAVFDEGLKSWGALALRSGMKFLSLRESAIKRMERLGFSGALVTPQEYPELEGEIQTLDFSGWVLFCHRDLPPKMAYKVAEAIDLYHARIPVDHLQSRSMTMEEFCHGGSGGKLTIPLHQGAKRYYREKRYLNFGA